MHPYTEAHNVLVDASFSVENLMGKAPGHRYQAPFGQNYTICKVKLRMNLPNDVMDRWYRCPDALLVGRCKDPMRVGKTRPGTCCQGGGYVFQTKERWWSDAHYKTEVSFCLGVQTEQDLPKIKIRLAGIRTVYTGEATYMNCYAEKGANTGKWLDTSWATPGVKQDYWSSDGMVRALDPLLDMSPTYIGKARYRFSPFGQMTIFDCCKLVK